VWQAGRLGEGLLTVSAVVAAAVVCHNDLLFFDR
jgi:hypothetical protein